MAAVQLTLYVRPESESSARAREVVQSVLSQFDPGDVSVRIVDIDRERATARAEGINYAPLVKLQRGDAPPSWVLNFDVETLARRLQWLDVQPRRVQSQAAEPRPGLRADDQ